MDENVFAEWQNVPRPESSSSLDHLVALVDRRTGAFDSRRSVARA